MMIGMVDTSAMIAAVAVAFTVAVFVPSIRMKLVPKFRVIVTRMRLTGSEPDRFTPGADVGKSTVTVSSAVLPNPLIWGNLHGVRASVVVQLKLALVLKSVAAPLAF